MNDHDSLVKIAGGAGIVFIGCLFSKILGYFYVLILARLGSYKFGLLNIGFGVYAIVGIIALLGLNTGVLRYVSFYKAKNDKNKIKGAIVSALQIALPLSLLLSSIIFIFANQIASLFHDNNLVLILRIMIIGVPFFVLGNIFIHVLRAYHKIGYAVGAREVIEKIVNISITLILFYFGLNIYGASIAYTVAAVSTFVISFYLMEKKVFSIFSKIKTYYYRNEMVKYSLPLVLTGFFFMIIRWVNTFILGYFKDASYVGIYNVSLSTADLMYLAPMALTTLSFPIMTERYSKSENKDLKAIYDTTTKWIFLVIIPIYLVFFFFSKNILGIMFGNEYSKGALTLSILAAGYILCSLSKTATDILSIAKKTKIIFYITLVAAIINVMLGFILVPKYNLIGAALSTSISFTIMGILFFYYAYKISNLQPIKWVYLKSFILGLISIIIVYKLSTIIKLSIYKLVFLLLLFLVIYLVLLYIFKCLDNQDKLIIKSFLQKIKYKNGNF
ncbi:MAG: flippase [Candidatus Woesearchaeota archaeon]|nr:flippase [Candidatus Woesearchaeota archaeon]